MTNRDDLVPVAEGALATGMSRERLVRAIQRRAVRGDCVGGHWFVWREEVERLAADNRATAA